MNRYSQLKVPPKEEFINNLKTLPFVATENMTYFLSLPGWGPVMEVPLSRIIGLRGASSWDLRDRLHEDRERKDYVFDLAKLIVSGDINFEDKKVPLVFIRIGDFYLLRDNGRHRLAALKGIGDGSVSILAHVVSDGEDGLIRHVCARKGLSDDVVELESRRDQGLWSGKRLQANKGSNCVSYADEYIAWRVDSYIASWVFARTLMSSCAATFRARELL